ncbi:MAG: hypothetical protein AUK35_07030 [Zetaproteobacteria bacterium CG2_30_46_52]|nr:MAG: hypothetical protein AUK35_07030 [Zetaproteobacteria bacterium CG2_30_46_52]
MRQAIIALLLVGCWLPAQTAQAASDVEVAGDILQVLIPSIGFGATLYLDDDQGRDQFLQSFASTVVITQVLKYSINRERPNGGSQSFPSGHTSAAFQGAAFIHARFGLSYAIPAYIGAAFVGYSRVESNKHYNSDVFAGALIGSLSAFYFSDPYNGISMQPKASQSGYGAQLSVAW